MTIRVVNSWKSCYCAANPAEMLVAIANGIIRKVVGTMNVDELYHNREKINQAVLDPAFDRFSLQRRIIAFRFWRAQTKLKTSGALTSSVMSVR
jgi:hypothetical protein